MSAENKTRECPECEKTIGASEKTCPNCQFDLQTFDELDRYVTAREKLKAKSAPKETPKQPEPEPEPERKGLFDRLRR